MKNIFICYSHNDEKWKNHLVKQLNVLQMQELLYVWDDSRIQASDDWYNEIKKALKDADAAVLMISADFLTSDFILKEEVPVLLQRRLEEGMKIFPLIVEHCPWTEIKWLKLIQARPKDGKPLSSFIKNKRDKILSDFAIEIKKISNQKKKEVKKIETGKLFKKFEEKENIQPKNAEAWCKRGIVFLNKGNLNEAHKSFDKALEIEPNYSEALKHLEAITQKR